MYRIMICILLGVCASAHAEFECRGNLSYFWKKSGEEQENSTSWIAVKRTADSEETARRAIEELLDTESRKALDECRGQHEGLAECIAGKFEASASMLRKLDFSARRTMEEAIKTECEGRQGRCLGLKKSEVHCEEKIEAHAHTEEDAEKAEEDGKKDKKTKNSKKH